MKSKSPLLRLIEGSALILLVPSLVAPASAATWTGAENSSWASAGNWTGTPPGNATPQPVVYDTTSAANLTQTLDGSYTLTGISLDSGLTGAVTINGADGDTLTLGAGGIVLAADSQNLTFGSNFPLVLGAGQTWTIAPGRTLAFDGNDPLAGNSPLGIGGGGTVQFGNNATLAGPVAFTGGGNTIALTGGGGNTSTALGLNFAGGADFGGATQHFTSNNENRSVGGTLSNGTMRVTGPGAMQFKAASTGVFNLVGGNGDDPENPVAGVIILNNAAISNPQLNVHLATANSALRLSSPFDNAGGTPAVIGNLTGVEGSFLNTNFNTPDLIPNRPRTLRVNQSVEGVFAGNINQADLARALTFEKAGPATLTLTGNNTATGGLHILEGALRIGGESGTLAPQPLTLGGGENSGMFVIGDAENSKFITVTTLSTSGDGTANAIVAGGTENIGSLNVSGGGTSLFDGVIGGGGFNENNLNLIKSGVGTLILAGANTYNGFTEVTGGTLVLTGSLASQEDTWVLDGAAISGTGTSAALLFIESSTLALTGGETTASLTVNGVAFTDFSAAPIVDFLDPPVAGTTYDVVTYGDGGVTGFDTLTAAYRGTLANDTANKKITFHYDGATGTRTWNTGPGTWDIATTPNFEEGDRKFFNGDTVIFGGIAEDTAITLDGRLAPASLDISNPANTYTFTGAAGVDDITGATSLEKSGAGALILSSPHTYTGGTVLSGGTLAVNATGALGGGGLAVSGDSTLTIGAATTISGAATFTGANTIGFTNGTLTFAGGADFGGAVQSISSNNENRAIAGAIANGTLRLTGGHLQFNAASTGAFTLEATDGQLIVNNAAVSNPQLDVNLTGTAWLRLASPFNNATLQIGNLTGAAGSLVTTNFGDGNHNARTLRINQSTDGTFAGQLTQGAPNALGFTRPLRLEKAGDATLELTGTTNNYSGGTLISAGTLLVGNTSGSATGTGSVTIHTGGTLGGNGSVSGAVTVHTGGFIAPGASVGVLTTGPAAIDGSYLCEIDGAAADSLIVNGDLTLGPGSTLTVSTPGGGLTSPSYVIATWTGTRTGTFANTPPGYNVAYNDTLKQIELSPIIAGGSYGDWASASGIPGAAPEIDSDNDGIPNGIEFVIGGNPAPGSGSDSNHLLPTATLTDDHFVFVFRRSTASAGYAPFVEYSSSLVGWTKAENGTDGIAIGSDPHPEDADIDLVTVSIPRALAQNDKLFARLRVDIP